MSYSLKSEQVVKVVDPRTDLDKPLSYVVEDGSQSVTWVQTDSNTAGTSGSSVVFTNSNPPGPGVIIDRKVFIRMGFTLTFTGIADNLTPLIGYENIADSLNPPVAGRGTNYIRALGTDAPRAFPLSQIVSSMRLTINNGSASEQIYEYIEPLLRYNTQRELSNGAYSTTPSKHDQFPEYNMWIPKGSARNVLGDYGEDQYYENRGGFSGLYMRQNPIGNGADVVTAIFELEIMEPLFISPLEFGYLQSRGLYGIQNFNLQLTFDDMNRIWSHDAVNGQNISSLSVIGSSTNIPRPQLNFNYLTPKLTQELPQINVYPYYEIDVLRKEYTQLVAGHYNGDGSVNPASFVSNFVSDSQNLQTIPKKMYIYVRQTTSTRTFNDSDTYARIDNLSIDFYNKNSLLNGANTEQLYQMSVKNGLNMSWTQWNHQVGSIICIDFSQDISLPDDLAVGVLDNNLQLRVKVNFTNLSPNEKYFTLYVCPSYPGIANVLNQQMIMQTGIISRADVLASRNIHKLDYYDLNNFYGGSFKGKMSSFYEKAKPIVNKLAKVSEELSTGTSAFAPRIGAVQKGVSRGIGTLTAPKPVPRATAAKKTKAGVMLGGLPMGGQILTQAQMSRRDKLLKKALK